MRHATYGPTLLSSDTWDTALGTWGDQVNRWNYTSTSPFAYDVIATGSGTIKAMHASNTLDYNTFLERIAFPMEGQVQVTTLNRIYPHIRCDGTVLIQVGSKDAEAAPIRWGPKISFEPNIQRKVDVRTTGKLHCWRIESVGNYKFTASGMDIEYERNGVR
jgi:hypothetical protein